MKYNGSDSDELFLKILKRVREFVGDHEIIVRFLVVGLIKTASTTGIFAVSLLLGAEENVGLILTLSLVGVISLILKRSWVFQSSTSLARSLVYPIWFIIYLVLADGLYKIFRHFGVYELLTAMAVILILLPLNFYISGLIFRK